jgi:hypothetical protein
MKVNKATGNDVLKTVGINWSQYNDTTDKQHIHIWGLAQGFF